MASGERLREEYTNYCNMDSVQIEVHAVIIRQLRMSIARTGGRLL